MAGENVAGVEPLAKRDVGNVELTKPEDKCAKVIAISIKKVFILFVGGAGDQESYYLSGPNWNVSHVRTKVESDADALCYLSKCDMKALAYNKFLTDEDLAKNVLVEVPDKTTPVYIIGHSLGGWNGAHLSSVLADKGYTIKMLITIDPVGQGKIVYGVSTIYRRKPEPKAEFWINIRAAKIKNRDISDTVADFGEQWEITSGPNVSGRVDVNHADADIMFDQKLDGGKSARQLLADSILGYLREK
ncbi:alpha/beta hydrolase [Pseudomonas sp. N40(2020)]|uniref:alpha/beta hydrolase n=1 Tax=Pseudomonas sp. N40(2020) TaxID=2767798 RepID=UPI00165736C5|nr:alpha/beta hydrolase [Pseudomonas sp. N40(2020)]MBC8996232.1 alpha/beta hydrolase [Pseudomonas sp. N40(2020)]